MEEGVQISDCPDVVRREPVDRVQRIRGRGHSLGPRAAIPVEGRPGLADRPEVARRASPQPVAVLEGAGAREVEGRPTRSVPVEGGVDSVGEHPHVAGPEAPHRQQLIHRQGRAVGRQRPAAIGVPQHQPCRSHCPRVGLRGAGDGSDHTVHAAGEDRPDLGVVVPGPDARRAEVATPGPNLLGPRSAPQRAHHLLRQPWRGHHLPRPGGRAERRLPNQGLRRRRFRRRRRLRRRLVTCVNPCVRRRRLATQAGGAAEAAATVARGQTNEVPSLAGRFRALAGQRALPGTASLARGAGLARRRPRRCRAGRCLSSRNSRCRWLRRGTLPRGRLRRRAAPPPAAPPGRRVAVAGGGLPSVSGLLGSRASWP